MNFFLSNMRSVKLGQMTTPALLSVSFMQAVFNMELQYDSGVIYTVRGTKPRSYHLHHLTQADLQLAIILQKCCNTTGHFYELTALSNIYDKMTEYFEDPICLSQFYASLEKFRLLGLLTYEQDLLTGTFNMELQHYRNEYSGRIGYYIKAHPFIFSRTFTRLSLREQKLFLSLYIQQGVEPSKHDVTFRCFVPTISDRVDYQDLQRFLHTNTTYVRQAINKLSSAPLLNGQPLFTKVSYRKDQRTYTKVFLQVNPLLHEHPKDVDCLDPIQPQIAYKRKATRLKNMLEEMNLGELVAYKQGTEFIKMVRLLRKSSVSIMKYVVRKIYDRYVVKEAYPDHVVPLIYDAVRDHNKLRLLALAKEHGIEGLITAGYDPAEKREIEHRETVFAEALGHLSHNQAKQLFADLAPILKMKYMAPLSFRDMQYRYDDRLSLLTGIIAIRKQAKRQYKDPREYLELERRAAEKYTAFNRRHHKESLEYHREVRRLMESMLEEIEHLPTLILRPTVTVDFRLEEEMLRLASTRSA